MYWKSKNSLIHTPLNGLTEHNIHNKLKIAQKVFRADIIEREPQKIETETNPKEQRRSRSRTIEFSTLNNHTKYPMHNENFIKNARPYLVSHT